MPYTVLAADDEAELLDALELFFIKENIQFIKAKDGKEALEMFLEHHPHLLLLDIMMPEPDGFQVLREIRKHSHVPAIMVTARDRDYDKILGLSLGADDYITKPYNPMEVVARVKAQLRRSYDYLSEEKEDGLRAGDLLLNPRSAQVTKDGVVLNLTKTEYLILQFFMENAGRVLTRRQIYEAAWEDSYMGDEATVMVHISNLRAKIEDDPKNPVQIKTIKGLGYRWEKKL